jgi:hypothetical protein
MIAKTAIGAAGLWLRDDQPGRRIGQAIVVIVERVAKSMGPRPAPGRFTSRRGSHTPGNGCPIVIDARRSSTRTSHAPGRKSSQTLSNVYLTICAAGSIRA